MFAASEQIEELAGTAGGRTHTVVGVTVNAASRIEGKAPAGGVAIELGRRRYCPAH